MEKEIQLYHASCPLSICGYLTDLIRSTRNIFTLQKAQLSLQNRMYNRNQNKTKYNHACKDYEFSIIQDH